VTVNDDESVMYSLQCNHIKEVNNISTVNGPTNKFSKVRNNAKIGIVEQEGKNERLPDMARDVSRDLSYCLSPLHVPDTDFRDTVMASPPEAGPPFGGLAAILELAAQIRLMLEPASVNLVGGDISSTNIQAWMKSAEELLGEDIIYNDKLIASLNLQEISEEHYRHNDAAIGAGTSLDSILSASLVPHKLKGQSAQQLRTTLKQVTNKHKIIDLLQNGQREAMIASFTPNGGREVSSGGSYRSMRAICNQSIFDLQRKGQCVIFSYDMLKSTGAMNELHVSPLVWATKPGKVLGRTCLHASKSSRNHLSYNESIDMLKSRQLYAKPQLPLLPDLAEMACRQQDTYPGQILAGATVDVSTAYNQFPMTPAAAKLTATQIDIPRLLGGWIKLIVIYIVGMFGCATAGDVYCQIAQTVDELHNAGRGESPRSKTYIDDGLLIDSPQHIAQSTEEYIGHVITLLGNNQTIQREKVRIWTSELEGIGWHFDFATWTVRPKAKGLAKMLLILFRDITLDATSISETDLDRLTGLLTWYAEGIPLGAKFVSSFYACKHKINEQSKKAKITVEMHRDLLWWRALTLVAYTHPQTIAASISSVRRNLHVDMFMHTDASSLVGGGAYISETLEGSPSPEYVAEPLRWTKAEMEIFQQMNTSINILEYFTVIYYVMVWSKLLRNKVVHIKCDNTSAVSWIMRNRAKHNMAAESLARIFSLFCLSHNITIICTHIKGVDNVLADYLSRDLMLAAQEADEEDGTRYINSHRAETCRKLLTLCITQSSKMHGQQILTLLTRLRSEDG
jgi:hypothetical protein